MNVPFERKYNCGVRKKACGHIFSGKATAFIATPSLHLVGSEIGVINRALNNVGIKPYVAAENIDPAKEVFCSKICAPIIEAKFCIAILTAHLSETGMEFPSLNVYYEYGLMTGFGKHIIPIQKEHQSLAFNIQSFDTVKYNDQNLQELITKAIDKTLQEILLEEHRYAKIGRPLQSMHLYMEMRGHQRLFDSIITHNTMFKAYKHWKYCVFCNEANRLKEIGIQLKLVMSRLNNLLNEKEVQIAMLEKRSASQIMTSSYESIQDKILLLKRGIADVNNELEINFVYVEPECTKEAVMQMLTNVGLDSNDRVRLFSLKELDDSIAAQKMKAGIIGDVSISTDNEE